MFWAVLSVVAVLQYSIPLYPCPKGLYLALVSDVLVLYYSIIDLEKQKEKTMSVALKKESYPYIESNPAIAGGSPVIQGTRITVRCIAKYYQMGMSVDEILNSLTHLTQAAVHAALTYYFDHQAEIDAEIETADNDTYWKNQAIKNG